MDVEWHQKHIDIAKSPVHEAIVKAGFHKIYTTNFDRWIERACDHWGVKYHKIINVNDIASRHDISLEIVKFHGDFDSDETLVLTETNYFERLDFQSPLDLILRADVLKHSVLFVGYSLSDINIRYLFHKLSRTWQEAGLTTSRPESYIYMMRPNPVDEQIFKQWGITPIVDLSGSNGSLADFLQSSVGKLALP
jgi:hypothetical protein